MKSFQQFDDAKRRYSDRDYMQLAIDMAAHAKSMGNFPVGAVLAWAGGKKIVEHDTRYTDCNPLNFAILNVINKAADTLGRHGLHGAVLYSTLEPNLLCALAIEEAGIKEVVFGAFDDADGYQSSRRLSEDDILGITSMGGVLGEACVELLPESIKEHVRYE